MPDNLRQLKKIPLLLEVERLSLTQPVLEKLGPYAKQAMANARKLFVYQFTYRSNGLRILGFLVEPRRGINLPGIVYARGGYAHFGSIKQGQLFSGAIADFALAGYAVIATQQSGGPGSEGADDLNGKNLNDILELFKIIKKYPRVDSTRLGMYGASRGGMGVFCCLKKKIPVKAAVALAPLTNLLTEGTFRPDMIAIGVRAFGKAKSELEQRTVHEWVDKLPKKIPILMMHGTADWRTDPKETIELSKKFIDAQIPHRLIIYEGGDHSLREFRSEAIRETIAWFDRFVKKGEALPNLKKHGD